MRGWKNGYMTRAALLTDIKRVLCKEHSDISPDGLLVNLETPWKEIKYPTGYICKCAFVILRAEGYRTTKKIIQQEKNKSWTMY